MNQFFLITIGLATLGAALAGDNGCAAATKSAVDSAAENLRSELATAAKTIESLQKEREEYVTVAQGYRQIVSDAQQEVKGYEPSIEAHMKEVQGYRKRRNELKDEMITVLEELEELEKKLGIFQKEGEEEANTIDDKEL